MGERTRIILGVLLDIVAFGAAAQKRKETNRSREAKVKRGDRGRERKREGEREGEEGGT